MKPAITYHELIEGYFGLKHRHRHRHGRGHRHHAKRFGLPLAGSAEQVLASYFGHEATRPRLRYPAGFRLSFAVDDGETLEPRARATALDEYVIEASLADSESGEYVIEASVPAVASMQQPDRTAPDPDDEYLVDVCDPLSSRSADRRAPSPSASDPAAAPGPAAGETARPSRLDEEFMHDIRAILSQSTSDGSRPAGTVQAERLRAAPAGTAGQAQPDTTPSTHAIFDRIAQSMQHANTYDLGTVELENRFSDFDQFDDLKQQQGRRRRAPEPPPAKAAGTEAAMAVGAEDFLSDLDQMQRGGGGAQRRSDDNDDPFAFVPPSQAGSRQPAPAGTNAAGADGAPAEAAPGQTPQIQIPSIQIPQVRIPEIQMPPLPGAAAPVAPAPDSPAFGPDLQ